MTQLYSVEVPVVDAGDHRDVQAFRHRHHMCIDDTKWEALVLLDQFNDAIEILRLGSEKSELAVLDGTQERDLGASPEMFLQVVAHFDHDRCGHKQRWRSGEH